MNLTLLLQLAAVCHLVLLAAGLTMPKAIALHDQLASLPVFTRRLFWVYYTFIGFTILSFGLLTWFFARSMADGDPLGRALCLMMTCFWMMRLVVAAVVLDERPFLTCTLYRLGNAALHAVFLFLTAVYTYTSLKGILL